MMKSFKKNEYTKKWNKYLYCSYFLLALVIVFNTIFFGNETEKFNFGELTILNLIEVYTANFCFPFIIGFFLIMYNVKRPSIVFEISRMESRDNFYNHCYIDNIKIVLRYLCFIVIVTFLASIGNSKFGFSYSEQFVRYFINEKLNINLNIPLIFQIILAIFLYFMLLLFLINFIFSLNLLNLNVGLVSFIYLISIILMTVLYISSGEKYRLFSIIGIFTVMHGNLIVRIILSIILNIAIYYFNLNIFKRKEINLPKGNKRYQNE